MNDTIKNQLEEKVLETYLTAQEKFKRNFDLPIIEFKDMGRIAGKAIYKENKIIFSPTLFAENVIQFLGRTVPHEIAHLITHFIHPNARQHHGPEWRSVMQILGVQDIKRCHSYDTSSVGQNRIKYLYSCQCQKRFEFGSAKHKRFQKGIKYWCLTCKTLHFTGVELHP